MFSFGKFHCIGSQDLFDNSKFNLHTQTIIAMVGMAIQLLKQGETNAPFAVLKEVSL